MTDFASLEKEMDRFVEKAMQTWNVPGLALAIVMGNQTLIAKGYGIREMDKPETADEHTLFAIGSNTKAFTATAMGLLVQDGKVAWDDPVTQYLPGFKMYDPHTTELITILDLLCHRAGLGTWAGDMLLTSKYSTEEIVRRIRHIPPEYSFRAGYGYCNLLFITAGHVIETVSGLSWDDFIRQRIFEPLGMTDSVTNARYFGERMNIARPHEDVKGRLQLVTQMEEAHVGAAGTICASAADIAQWLRMQLAEGSLDGQQLVDPGIIAETRTPHANVPMRPMEKKLFPSRHFSAYGLGWFLSDTHGRFIVRHTGGVNGMLSSVVMIPEEKLGIAVFTNKLPNAAYIIVPHFLTEKFLGLESRDWIQTYIDLEMEMKEKEAQAAQKRDEARAKDTHPSLGLEKYAGEYESAILGGATLSVDGSGLHIQLEAHETLFGTLEHWQYDTFLCMWDDPVLRESFIPFITDGRGNVVEFRVKIREDWLDPLEHVFKKKME